MARMIVIVVALSTWSACTRSNPCACPTVEDPVCGTNGTDYVSACSATCEGATIDRAGACAVDLGTTCVCPDVSDPVCGKDGHEFANACLATCAGVVISSAGHCDVLTPCGADGSCPTGQFCRLDVTVCGQIGNYKLVHASALGCVQRGGPCPKGNECGPGESCTQGTCKPFPDSCNIAPAPCPADCPWSTSVCACECAASSCGGAAACAPACDPGKLCCGEPTHMFTDGGVMEIAYSCLEPTNGMCPKFP